MTGLLTLLRPHGPAPGPTVPEGYLLRPCRSDDAEELGRLYFASYEPGQGCATLTEAVADIRAALSGAYGELWPQASPVATDRTGRIVAAVQVVRRAAWDDTPDCPFVIELFTHPAHRRRGLARVLLLAAREIVARSGPAPLALRVAAGNEPAQRLYRDLGFHDWNDADAPARGGP